MKALEMVKKMMLTIKKWVWVLIAGVVIGAVAWRSHVVKEMGDREQLEKENKVKEEAAAKLAEETAKIEAERKAKEAQIEADAKKKEEEGKYQRSCNYVYKKNLRKKTRRHDTGRAAGTPGTWSTRERCGHFHGIISTLSNKIGRAHV